MAYLYINAPGLKVSLKFPAYVTSFSDSFKASYTEEALPYNIDPYRAYSNTTRNISISFDIISENVNDSKDNLQKLSLMSSLVFAVKTSSAIIKPPMLKMFYFNLLRDPYADGSDPEKDGLTCKLLSYDVKPEFESGFFTDSGNQAIFPKLIKLSMQIVPYHIADIRPEVQFGSNGSKINGNYPYFVKKDNMINSITEPYVQTPGLQTDSASDTIAKANEEALNTGRGVSLPPSTSSAETQGFNDPNAP